jgi:hypothetical protein
MEDYEQLFSKIEELRIKCKKEDPFNAFLTIGVNKQEVMHSQFIAMLLNPKGEHKHGAKFLELFLQKLEIKEFVTKNAVVSIEKYAQGRRFDISIESQNQLIIIENKVWAIDQPRQLIDYYNYGIGTGNKVFMIYLTPYGRLPSDDSLGNGELPQEKITCISYEKHILGWLEDCLSALSESKNMRLKLSLEMYEELVRNTINRDKYMNEIMSNLMINPQNMGLAIDIIKSFQCKNFLEDMSFRDSFIKQIEKSVEIYYEFYTEKLSNSWAELILDDNGKGIGSICFDGCHIYGKKINGTQINEHEIVCNNLNDSNLINLLIKNELGVNEWVGQIIDALDKE